jgi:DnaJ like chaperone protein
MEGSEWLVVIVCAVLGYMVVSWLMGGSKRQGASPPEAETVDRSAPLRPAGAEWAKVLGVSPAASADDIRSAYRQLMSQYHPDKVASLGFELRELAERKSKEIGAAYAAAMHERGFD